jgi:hypothetical protein
VFSYQDSGFRVQVSVMLVFMNRGVEILGSGAGNGRQENVKTG